MMRRLVLTTVLVVVAVSIEAAGTSIVANQDRLLCPAELIVLRADASRLASTTISGSERRGIRNRIGAALATLPWLCRRYLEVSADVVTEPATGKATKPDASASFIAAVRALSEPIDSPTELAEAVDSLIDQAPLPLDSFHFDQPGDADEEELAGIYRTYCHGCHSTTDSSSENPAFPLDQMARQQSDREFFARMLLGVRGTADIGLSNPLTAIEIGAMARFLRQTD